ncbi:NADAR domain-containing protein [Paenibacillus sp. FSL M7-0831]|uniref:NADAR domain-containing protein n=1 Tax=Paenibacillus sp. FSL M7-0831 TaxID=2975314 RepID=UPI0030F712A0
MFTKRGIGAVLLGTGTRVLVEASPVDRIWGVGLAADDERIENPLLWQGNNLLGFALMEVQGYGAEVEMPTERDTGQFYRGLS